MRKLLPYEYQLIETLGITKEEYFEFIAIQQEYKDPKVGTALDIRNGPGVDPVTVSIVLTVVGILFQVGAALLAPKPEIPSVSDRRRRTREQRFAPSFGFNGTQELASYGDPVNLVYTNQNSLGDVRVAGSLVWSAVDNFGSTQFMRLLLVIGAGEIQSIAYGRTAFGQTGLGDLDKQNVFIFQDVNLDDINKEGPPPFNAISDKFANKDLFPSSLKKGDETKQAFVIPTHENKKTGYSQAYTPSTSTSLGVFDAIPINVDVKTRDKDGDRQEANISILLKEDGGTANNKWRNYSGGNLRDFKVNDTIEASFLEVGHVEDKDDKKPAEAADNLRRQMLESLDFGSTYMLGSAKFRLQSVSSPRNLESDEVKAKFVCVEQGKIPGTPYNEQDPINPLNDDLRGVRRKFQREKRKLEAKNEDFRTTDFSASEIVLGNTYRVRSADLVDFRDLGADSNDEGDIFVAEAVPTEVSASDLVQNGGVQEVDIEYRLTQTKINFSGTQEVTWDPEYVSTVSKEFHLNNRQYTDADRPEERIYVEKAVSTFDPRTIEINRFGSIRYTQNLLEELIADKPVLKTNSLKRQIQEQIQRLQRLRNKVASSSLFDGVNEKEQEDEQLFVCRNDFETGFNGNGKGKQTKRQVRKWDEEQFQEWAVNQATMEPGKDHHKNRAFPGVKAADGNYYFTFLYIDSCGRWNLFNFNGIQDENERSQVSFPGDLPMNQRRLALMGYEGDFFDAKDENRRITGDNFITRIKQEARESGPSDIPGRSLVNSNAKPGSKKGGLDNISTHADVYHKEAEAVGGRLTKLENQRKQEAVDVISRDIELLEQLSNEIVEGDEEQIKGKKVKTGIEDSVGTQTIKSAYKDLIEEKQAAVGHLKNILDNWDEITQSFDNNFFSKCLVKADTASYSTLSEVNMVNFSFKTSLFRRISGRQKKYGEEKVRAYSESDNGVKTRMAFFRMSYQQYKNDGALGDAVNVPYMIAVRHGSESSFYTQLSFYSSSATPTKWRFVFTPVYDILSEHAQSSFNHFIFLENSTNLKNVQVGAKGFERILWYGRLVKADEFRSYYPDEGERGPVYTNEWDMFSVNSDTQVQFSFESGPEIQLTAVTEQQFDNDSNLISKKFGNMSMMGVGVFAGRGLEDLRSVTALVKRGKICHDVYNFDSDPSDSSSYAPDIFMDTLLDKENGFGKYIGKADLDEDSLVHAKNFCIGNNLPLHFGTGPMNLFMDGLIADAGSWREFWINNAPFSLLELARKNGKDTLVPALPANSAGVAAHTGTGIPVEVQISALFTTGNILEGSYKEEFLNYEASTEDLIASVIYREYTNKELFSQNRSVEVRLADASASAVRETFDLSQFVTQREQAIMFGKLLCNQRRYIKKGIEFQTIPSQASVEPGDFIYVDVGLKKWDSYSSGIIMADGTLNAPLMQSQSEGTTEFNFLLYNKESGNAIHLERISVTTTDGVSKASSLAGYVGQMFVMGAARPSKRVYRVTEIAIEEEGEVSIKAIEYPCFLHDGTPRASIADFRSGLFTVS